MNIPVPATAHATREPTTPVCAENVPGSEKTPAPTIEPTTNVDRVRVETVAGAGADRATTESDTAELSGRGHGRCGL
jgi:hypothetical protein